MVIRVVALAAIAACVIACETQEAPPDARAPITVDEIANASPLAGTESTIDTLVLNYAKGDVFRYRAVQVSTGGVDSAIMEQRSTHIYTKRIRNVRGDGTFEIGMTFDTIMIDVKATSKRTGQIIQEQHFTSADSAQRKDPAFAQFGALIGEEVTIILRPNATIQEISGVSSIVNKIIGDQPVPAETRAQFTRQIELAAYAAFVEQEYLRFPENGLDSAGGWTTSNAAPILNNIFIASSTARYHVDAVKKIRGQRIADVSSTLSGTVTTGNIPKGSTLRVRMGRSEIVGKGRAVVDVDMGYTISKTTDLTTDLQATVTNTATNQSQMMSQRTSMRTTVQLVR